MSWLQRAATGPLQRVSDAGQVGEPARNAAAEASDAELLDAYSQAVIRVVERVGPAVVSITGAGEDPRGGSGSGFVITPDGFVVTNSHVVGGRRTLRGITQDGDKLSAQVVGDDPPTDLALLRVSARDLPLAELGDSQTLRVGQLCIAIGSPLGLASTVSTGVVSSLQRSMRGGDGRLIEDVIQHTAPINPGNSGGPLVDSRGRVIGINTAIVAMAQGLGFAVPSQTAQWVVGELLAHGKVRRQQIGISGATVPLPRRIAREFDLLGESAVQVAGLLAGGAAERAGIRVDDLIVAVDGRIVEAVDDLHRWLGGRLAREALEIEVVRGERLLTLAVRPDVA
jgi:S1-C subfamily serine protease